MKKLLTQFSISGEILFLTLCLAQLVVWVPKSSAQVIEEWKAPARAARKVNPIPSDEKSIALGKAVYTRECFTCHGTTGKGDGPQAKDLERPVGNLSDPKVLEETDGALFWKVAEGKKPMPTFEQKLTEEERWQVINYLRTFAPQGASGKQLQRGENK